MHGAFCRRTGRKPWSANKGKLELIEQNLAIGLESGNPGLQASAALVLDELKTLVPDYGFDLTVIPLMRLVRHSGYSESARLAAGLALHDLHSSTGDFIIARVARVEQDARIKKAFTAMSYERGLQDALN